MKRVIVAILAIASSTFAVADEVECLAKNIYWEARNQSIQGMYAVADVTLNRVSDKRWPSTVCTVVKQRKRGICQFSWYCDGKSDIPKTKAVYNLCTLIAYASLYSKGAPVVPENVYWYHAESVSPYWADAYRHHATIGDHRFYAEK